MGLWEFLRQWQRGRIVTGVVVSILLHLLLAVGGLWGLVPGLAPQWKTKPGDSLIVELPRLDEPAAAGVPSPAPPAPAPAPRAPTPAPPAPAPVARVEPRAAPPAQAREKPAPAREKPAPPREEQRVAAAARPSPPAPPAPRAPETPSSLSEPAPRAAEPTPRAAEPAPPASEPAPRASEPARQAPEPGQRGFTPVEPRREGGERQVASVPPAGAGRPSLGDVRAALRSGSGGVAAQGRGGIEGDPIALDSTDARYSDYLEQVKRKIMEKWGYPCVKNPTTRECEPHATSLLVQFGILKDGRIQYVDIERFADHVAYDEYAVNAIKLASPYPPVPPAMMQAMRAGSAGLALRAHFIYSVETSITRFLR